MHRKISTPRILTSGEGLIIIGAVEADECGEALGFTDCMMLGLALSGTFGVLYTIGPRVGETAL